MDKILHAKQKFEFPAVFPRPIATNLISVLLMCDDSYFFTSKRLTKSRVDGCSGGLGCRFFIQYLFHLPEGYVAFKTF